MKIAVKNSGDSPRYVAGRMIPPGETEHFERHELPPAMRPAAETPAPAEAGPSALEALVAGKAADVVAALETLPDDDLAAVDALETAGKARKTVLEAIQAEWLRRAADAGEGGAGGEGGEGQGGQADD